MAAYDLSKAAVRMLATVVRARGGRHGIRVNAVAPGTVATELVEGVLSDERSRG